MASTSFRTQTTVSLIKPPDIYVACRRPAQNGGRLAMMDAFHAAERDRHKHKTNCQAGEFQKLQHGKPPMVQAPLNSVEAAEATQSSVHKRESKILTVLSCQIKAIYLPKVTLNWQKDFIP
jgi:hypothetical protein